MIDVRYQFPPPGLVGNANSKTFFAFLQHIFCGPGVSHAFCITYQDGYARTIPMVFEADMTVTHTPFSRYLADKTVDFWLYSIIGETPEEMVHSLDKCIEEFSGVSYGFTNTIWFVWEWFNRVVLHRDVRHEKNWFTDGIICTELWYYRMWYMTELHPERWTKLRAILQEWNPDTIQAYDTMKIMTGNPDIFKPYGKFISGVYTPLI